MVGGEKDGLWQEWFKSGSLKAKGAYRAGKKVGTWTYFDGKGNRIAEPRSAGN